jgi:hypothetical protein
MEEHRPVPQETCHHHGMLGKEHSILLLELEDQYQELD